MHWYDHSYGMSTGGWVVLAVGILLVLSLLVVAAVLLARAGRRPPPSPTAPPPRSAEQMLAERFARGEIDEEEYRGRLATLTGTKAGRR